MVLKTNIYFTMVPLSCLFISRSLLRCNYSSVHAVFPSHVFSLLGERFGSMVLWWCWWGLWNPWTITPYCCSSTWAPLILLGGSWDWSHGSGSEEQGHRSQGFLRDAPSEDVGLEKKWMDSGGQRLVAQQAFGFHNHGDPFWGSRTAQKRLNLPDQVRQKLLCH